MEALFEILKLEDFQMERRRTLKQYEQNSFDQRTETDIFGENPMTRM